MLGTGFTPLRTTGRDKVGNYVLLHTNTDTDRQGEEKTQGNKRQQENTSHSRRGATPVQT